jgi:glycosyltransferase involved in cell wall biosynthesis
VLHVYTICWNEERILPFFLRHYGRFADRIVVYDNYSTDASRQIVAAHPRTDLRSFGAPGEPCGDWERVVVKRHAWKESRGRCDWVIVVDCDELLCHPALTDYLRSCRAGGVTLPRPKGYEMVSEAFPEVADQLPAAVPRGRPSPRMDKWVVFDPAAVDEIGYEPGCHVAHPRGRVVFDDPPALRLLHFKNLGFAYLLRRYRELRARRSPLDRQIGWGHHYDRQEEELRASFEELLRSAEPVLESPG